MLVTASGAASCSASLDQQALGWREGSQTQLVAQKVFLTGTRVRSPPLPRSCSRMNEGRPGSAPRGRLVCRSQPSPANPPSSGPCVPGGGVSLLSLWNLGCRSKNSFCHLPEPVHVALRGGWTHGSHGVAEFMGHVWERPEEVADALGYTVHMSLTSWFLWIMVSGA